MWRNLVSFLCIGVERLANIDQQHGLAFLSFRRAKGEESEATLGALIGSRFILVVVS